MAKPSDFHFIDLFAGAGGLSTGLEMTGMKCLLGVDFDVKAMETFKKNHDQAEVFCGDIKSLTSSKLDQLIAGKTIDLIAGGPPCQGFSTVGLGNPNDLRNSLFREYCRIVRHLKPNYLIMENVTGMLAKKNEKVLEMILKTFAQMGYQTDIRVLSAHHYGVPEKRRRTILIGTRLGHPLSFPVPSTTPSATVGDALKQLNKKTSFKNHDLEKAKISNELDRERLHYIPEGKGIRYAEDEQKYLPKKLHLKLNWKELPEERLRQTKYQRLDRKSPSPTIMTHRHSYYHPTETRYLTVREAALIQSFPIDFEFCGSLVQQWRQVGNAVPPFLGKALGEVIWEMKKRYQGQKQPSRKTKNTVSVEDRLKVVRKKAFVYQAELTP